VKQREHPLDLGGRRRETARDRPHALGEIAGVVNRIDQEAADQALGRIGRREIELGLQVLVQRQVGGEPLAEVRGVAVETAAGPDIRPGGRLKV
jgi:hypothetical protein